MQNPPERIKYMSLEKCWEVNGAKTGLN